MDTYGTIAVLVILILLSGFFSASETALTAFKSKSLEELDKKQMKKKELLKIWFKKPNEILTGVLIGNNIVNILSSSLAAVLIQKEMGSGGKGVLISTLIMTIVILIFGEITPKIVAKTYSKKVSTFVITPIYILTVICTPIIKILMIISKIIGKLFGIDIHDEGMMITEEDIRSYVNVGEAEGLIEEGEKEMIHSIFEFGETTAKEVMTPRTSMFALEASKKVEEVWEQIKENGFSRIPVYGEEGIDNILGILYLKDLLDEVVNGRKDITVGECLREVYFVPETKSIMELLQEFKVKKVHIAIALDEYGGTSGLLTIEDLLEEIVGEIQDEYDNEEEEIIKEIKDGYYEIDAMIDIETLNKELDTILPESENYESLGGLVVNELGKVAEIGDKVDVEGFEISVLEVDKKRVSKVALERIEEEEESEGED